MTPNLRDVALATLLFHEQGPWTAFKALQWLQLTGNTEATAKVLCASARKALAEYDAAASEVVAGLFDRDGTAMNEMFDRCVEAASETHVLSSWDAPAVVRAVLTALREPTEAMANLPVIRDDEYGDYALWCWREMIDAALKPASAQVDAAP